MEGSFWMNAILIDRNAVFVSSAEKHSATGLCATERVSGNRVTAYIKASKASVEAILVRLSEPILGGPARHAQAEADRLSRPLSLDEAWTGRWYERSRMLQKTVAQAIPNRTQSTKPYPRNWDDRLD